jgi:hypothetical protein
MLTPVTYAVVSVIVLAAILALTWLGGGTPLVNPVRISGYAVAVVIVLGLLIGIAWYISGPQSFQTYGSYAAGFLIGMLAMYIAVHVYRA